MRRFLAPAFVTTVALTACGKTGTTNPPEPDPTITRNPPQPPQLRRRARTSPAKYNGQDGSKGHPTAPRSLNPKDAKGRDIYVGADDYCVVHVERDNPKQPLPTGAPWWKNERVDCPPEMDDPAWDHCTEQLVASNDGNCFCDPLGGNPPPPPRSVTCPASARIDAGSLLGALSTGDPRVGSQNPPAPIVGLGRDGGARK